MLLAVGPAPVPSRIALPPPLPNRFCHDGSERYRSHMATILPFPRRGRFLSLAAHLCDLCDSEDDLVLIELESRRGRRSRAWRCATCIEAGDAAAHG